MNESRSYLETNRAYWDARVEAHALSDFYQMKGFREGWCSLKEPELGYLGDVRGRSVLHLQCHFGQDSLSLARRGALVTGVDFSELRKINPGNKGTSAGQGQRILTKMTLQMQDAASSNIPQIPQFRLFERAPTLPEPLHLIKIRKRMRLHPGIPVSAIGLQVGSRFVQWTAPDPVGTGAFSKIADLSGTTKTG